MSPMSNLGGATSSQSPMRAFYQTSELLGFVLGVSDTPVVIMQNPVAALVRNIEFFNRDPSASHTLTLRVISPTTPNTPLTSATNDFGDIILEPRGYVKVSFDSVYPSGWQLVGVASTAGQINVKVNGMLITQQ